MKEEISKRINALRAKMREHGVQAVIIPQTDPHQSEYLADHWEVRRFLSGFTGSAGTLVVTADDALLWTDSRYFIQANSQLQDTGIKLMKIAIPGVPTISEYLTSTLKEGDTIGFNGMNCTVDEYSDMEKTYNPAGIALDTSFDVIDEIWTDRPSLPKDKIFIHDEKYAGESAKSKINGILERVAAEGAESAFISALDEIAWTLNIRCNDVEFNPVAYSYLFISKSGSTLFIDPDKLDDTTKEYLLQQGVKTAPYNEVKEFLSALPADQKVLIDPGTTSIEIGKILNGRIVEGFSPIAVAKGCKNSVQIEGFRKVMERDGAALVRAFMAIEQALANGDEITELDVAALLRKYRSEQPLFVDESFGTIAGYGPHGAIVHYEADKESNVKLQPEGLLLVDSGAQYLDGTTDITRTIALGTPTEKEKHDFTLVMRGHIALARMIFPKGTRGVQLDVEARKFLWREGQGYLHGTGHGIGHFLNVHEGPQSIRMNENPMTLMLGMITSNEPGLYLEGEHGVRCENLVLCVPDMTTDFGEFYKFEDLTLFPFDTTLMETEVMTPDEIKWVNDYHAEVRRRLSPYLNDKEREWLENKTLPIK